jgi:hypothetical protein
MSTNTSPSPRLPRSALLGGVLVAAAVLGFAYKEEPKPTLPAAVAAAPGPAGDAPLAPMNPYEGELPPGHPPIDQLAGAPAPNLPSGHPPVAASAAAVDAKVAPLADGTTIAHVLADAAKLEGQRVRIAAKIVKRTANVLGRTWLHVQDGGGGDLVVTTESAPELGAEVIVEGVVRRDRDLGSGYRYDVLVEDAAVTVRPGD